MASKKGTPQHENKSPSTCPEAPREAASRASFSNKKQKLEHTFQTIAAQAPVLCLKILFELVFIAKFRKNLFEKLLVILHAVGEGPENYCG